MKLFKNAVRRAVWSVKSWLREPARHAWEAEEHRHPNSAYQLINRALVRLVLESEGALRPNYTWGVLHAAHLGRALGYKRISAIEFGVAGGNGLISLEKAAIAVEELLGISIDVYGFDTGEGLPKPQDYRDLPNLFKPSTYKMDVDQLRKRLTRAQLVLGDIGKTLGSFLEHEPAPVGFASIDVDLYGSTVQTLKLFESHQKRLLPRVHCYFDDIIGWTYAEFNGERLAMNEFNEAHPQRKFSPIYGLSHFVPQVYAHDHWPEKMYLAHLLDHDLYGAADGLTLHSVEQAERALHHAP